MRSWSSIALPALLSSSGLIPVLPWFLASLREPSSKFKQKVPLVELCAKLCCSSLFLFPLCILCPVVCTWNSLPLLPFWHLGPLFFSYCCPTLVVRWTVLLPKTLNRWTGLHNQRWVRVSSAAWSAALSTFPAFACYPDGWTQQSFWSTWFQNS